MAQPTPPANNWLCLIQKTGELGLNGVGKTVLSSVGCGEEVGVVAGGFVGRGVKVTGMGVLVGFSVVVAGLPGPVAVGASGSPVGVLFAVV